MYFIIIIELCIPGDTHKKTKGRQKLINYALLTDINQWVYDYGVLTTDDDDSYDYDYSG